MGHRAHSGSREPRQAKEWTDGAQDDNEEKIQVEPRALHQTTFLLTDNQSEEFKKTRKKSNAEVN